MTTLTVTQTTFQGDQSITRTVEVQSDDGAFDLLNAGEHLVQIIKHAAWNDSK